MAESDFEAFYSATSRRAVGHLFAMVGNLAEAQDAVAEAYARAWQRWSKVSTYNDPEAWVRTVAFRIAVSEWRRSRNRMIAYRRHGAAEDLPGATADQLVLIAALKKIPEDQRRVVVLHHLVGLNVEEIAHEVGAPTGTVKSRLVRGRRALAGHVSEFADEAVMERRDPSNV